MGFADAALAIRAAMQRNDIPGMISAVTEETVRLHAIRCESGRGGSVPGIGPVCARTLWLDLPVNRATGEPWKPTDAWPRKGRQPVVTRKHELRQCKPCKGF